MLAFASVYFSESGLFNELRPIQMRIFLPFVCFGGGLPGLTPPAEFRDVLALPLILKFVKKISIHNFQNSHRGPCDMAEASQLPVGAVAESGRRLPMEFDAAESRHARVRDGDLVRRPG